MHLQSSIVAELLLIALVVGIAGVFYYTNQNLLYGVSSQVESTKIASNQLIVHNAVVTTPYTWKVFLQNVGRSSIDLNVLHPTAYLYKGKELCGASKGFLSDTSTIQPGETATIYFYGFDNCTYEPNKKYTLKLGVGDQSLSSPATLDSSVYLWIPFTSVHTFDFSGKHPVYYHTGTLATLYGYHDGTASNFDWSTDLVAGVKGEAVVGDGDNNIVTDHLSEINVQESSFAVAFWYKPLYDTSGYKAIVDMGRDQEKGFWILTDKSNYKLLFGEGNGTVTREIYQNNTLQPSKWYFVVCEYNKASNSMRMKILNSSGDVVFEGSLALDIQPLDSNESLQLLGNNVSGQGEVNGIVLDEVRIYNRPLTDDEIKALYRGEDIRKGLVLYYSFDRNTIDTSNNTIYDVHMWAEGGLYFDGNNDYATIGTTYPYSSKPFTIVALYKEQKYVTTGHTVVIGAHSGATAVFHIYNNNGLQCAFFDLNTQNTASRVDICLNGYDITSKKTLSSMSFNPASKIVQLCGINGDKLSCVEGSYDPVADDASTGIDSVPLTVGTWWSGSQPNEWMEGEVYEIRLYSRALSPDEIRCIYENPDCLIDDKNLIAIYTLDFPDGAWADVPNWHQTPAAPRIRKDSVSRYFEDDVDTYLLVKNYELHGLANFSFADSVFIPIAYNGPSTVDSPKDLYYGASDENVALSLVEENSGGSIIGASIDFAYNCPSGAETNSYDLTPGRWQTTVLEWGPERNIFGFLDGSKSLDYVIPSDCNTVFDVKPEETLHPEAFKRLVIGANSSLAENSSNKHRFVLALTRRLNSYEINALCKLFGTC